MANVSEAVDTVVVVVGVVVAVVTGVSDLKQTKKGEHSKNGLISEVIFNVVLSKRWT